MYTALAFRSFLDDITDENKDLEFWYKRFGGYLYTDVRINPYIFILSGPHTETVLMNFAVHFNDLFSWETPEDRNRFLTQLTPENIYPRFASSKTKPETKTQVVAAIGVKSLEKYLSSTTKTKFLLILDPQFSVDSSNEKVHRIQTSSKGRYPRKTKLDNWNFLRMREWINVGRDLFEVMPDKLIPPTEDHLLEVVEAYALAASRYNPGSFECLHLILPALVIMRPNFFRENARSSPEKLIRLQFSFEEEQAKALKPILEKLRKKQPPSGKQLSNMRAGNMIAPVANFIIQDYPMYAHLPFLIERYKNQDVVFISYETPVKCSYGNNMDIMIFHLRDPPIPANNEKPNMSVERYQELISLVRVGNCVVCQKEPGESKKFKRCGGCYFLSYCSSTCQRNDWPDHKESCSYLAKARLKADFKSKGEI